MNAGLKDFARQSFFYSKSDLFAMFIERGFELTANAGYEAMVTMQSWLFLSSYEAMRKELLATKTISTMIQIGYNSFPEINSKVAQAIAFSAHHCHINTYKGTYINLNSAPQSADKKIVFLHRDLSITHYVVQNEFKKLHGSPIAYWINDRVRQIFVQSRPIRQIIDARQGLATADDGQFLRLWHEVSLKKIGFGFASKHEALISARKWFPFNKGGPVRKWYGNNDYLVDWEYDGKRLKDFRPRAVIRNEDAYFQEGITWSLISSSAPSFRYCDLGQIIGHKGPGIYSQKLSLLAVLAYLNSSVVTNFLKIVSPTMGFEVGQIQNLPFRNPSQKVIDLAQKLVDIHRRDWDSYEISWGFQVNTCIFYSEQATTVEMACAHWVERCHAAITLAKELEEENNRLFIDAYGLQDELSPDVPDEQITLYRPNREEDIKRLLSYAIGCMMGRYSLDKPGLIYAHSGNTDFDPSQYSTFPADSDGIIPIMETNWFPDDASNRLVEFISVAWSKEHLST